MLSSAAMATTGSSSLTMTSMQTVTIRVLVAGTGVAYKIPLHPAELTVSNIRRHLAAAVPPEDQILLIGPPYKVPKDSYLRSEETLNALRLGDVEDDPILEEGAPPRNIIASSERSAARRLFLFSKQLLSENAPDPTPCHLEPVHLALPDEAPGPSPLTLDRASSPPLHQALAAYERQFMLYLAQGRILADGADLRFAACQSCVLEQAVMGKALRAAVSNLSDHFHGAARTRAEFTATFQQKTAAHAALLQRFESILQQLANLQLHPSLISIARASGRTMETLLDTVPVERERNWAQQCQTSHQRLLALFQEVDQAFAALGTPASREQETQQDREAENYIQELWTKVESTAKEIRSQQSQRLERLTVSHGQAVKITMNAINANNDDTVQAAFTPLREMSDECKNIVPTMIADDEKLKELMLEIAESKTQSMKRMKVRLREVSLAQSSIQRALSSVGVLRDALTQQSDNMIHLEHVAELPHSYQDFLSEIRRRRAFGHAVASSSAAMMERLATMRDDEVKAREKFLRGPGRHLMPPFFEIFAPTLATPPPLFTPQLPSTGELGALPDVGQVEEAPDAVMQGTAVVDQGVSSASSLTAETQQAQRADDQEAMMGSANVQQQDQLIVSASEPSGHDLILDPASGTAADAEAKTLAYENAVLRQALERLGGKPPRSYIQEARGKEGNKPDETAAADLIAALRKELTEAKAHAEAAREALRAASASRDISDKISHSSFTVGDVGLFMPTGHGSGGKRTYLAFHTKCPYRFLSTDCIKGTPDFVLGRIVYQEELVAGEIGTDANPYGLPVGTKFWVLTVEVLTAQT